MKAPLAGPSVIAWAGLAAVLVGALAGCDAIGGTSPREAWEATLAVRMARDYPALWESLASESKAEVQRVLTHVKRDPDYLTSMQQKFQIPAATLVNMDARDFFLALMRGVERNLPGVVNLQLQNAQGAQFVREAITDDRAIVYWLSGTGTEEQTFFVREAGSWRPVLQRN